MGARLALQLTAFKPGEGLHQPLARHHAAEGHLEPHGRPLAREPDAGEEALPRLARLAGVEKGLARARRLAPEVELAGPLLGRAHAGPPRVKGVVAGVLVGRGVDEGVLAAAGRVSEGAAALPGG